MNMRASARLGAIHREGRVPRLTQPQLAAGAGRSQKSAPCQYAPQRRFTGASSLNSPSESGACGPMVTSALFTQPRRSVQGRPSSSCLKAPVKSARSSLSRTTVLLTRTPSRRARSVRPRTHGLRRRSAGSQSCRRHCCRSENRCRRPCAARPTSRRSTRRRRIAGSWRACTHRSAGSPIDRPPAPSRQSRSPASR